MSGHRSGKSEQRSGEKREGRSREKRGVDIPFVFSPAPGFVLAVAGGGCTVRIASGHNPQRHAHRRAVGYTSSSDRRYRRRPPSAPSQMVEWTNAQMPLPCPPPRVLAARSAISSASVHLISVGGAIDAFHARLTNLPRVPRSSTTRTRLRRHSRATFGAATAAAPAARPSSRSSVLSMFPSSPAEESCGRRLQKIQSIGVGKKRQKPLNEHASLKMHPFQFYAKLCRLPPDKTREKDKTPYHRMRWALSSIEDGRCHKRSSAISRRHRA